MLINSTWPQYFKNRHEGLGTTYERFILNRHFERIHKRFSIKSVLESPSFGMTGVSGINSIWWALQGSKVTIVDHEPVRIDLIKQVWQELALEAVFFYQSDGYTSLNFADNSFDLCWNFAALMFVANMEMFLKELARISRKTIFICIPNRNNPFCRWRLAYQKKHDDSLNSDAFEPEIIKNIMRKLNWQLAEQGYLDVPPWPDIAMNKEELFRKIGLKRLAETPQNSENRSICILDYFSGKNSSLEKDILKYNWLENSPWFIKNFWAHHRYFIFEKVKE